MPIRTTPIPELTEKDKSRFWSKIEKRGPDECWEWVGCRDRGEYGNFWLCGKYYLAHRITWFLEHGSIPLGKFICHNCDNPPCCNSNHFFLGTSKENIQDAVKKGRMASGDEHYLRVSPGKVPRGERNGNRKLTNLGVLEIRKRYSSGEVQWVIAEDFGITTRQVRRVVSKESWAHV